jgi:tetratricopeptide (TPR) repeat protein
VDKERYNLKQSTTEFLKLAEEGQRTGMVVDARYQIANIYQQEGKYEEAIDIYLKLSEEYKEHELSAFCLFQAGASYLYDLNDQEKADEIFKRLKERYPGTIYSDFTDPKTSVGMFLTFVVPRATRVVAWRGTGLMCLSGYSGEMVKFKAKAKQESFNKAFSDWLKVELPDTVGNIWVDINSTVFTFNKDRASASGHITMGKFEVDGETEGYLKKTDNGSIRLVITKAILENIPIPPIFVNMALSGVFLIVERYFPITVTDIAMDDEVIYIDGFGGKRIVERIKKSAQDLMSVDIIANDIYNANEEEKLYSLYAEKFPWGNFSPSFDTEDINNIFFDFFSRMTMYAGFKLLETVKDSKLDYGRSVRTLGKLDVKKENFRVTYTEPDVNASLNLYILKEFPWIIDNKHLFDIKGLECNFKDNGQIHLNGYLSIGHNIKKMKDASNITVKAVARLEIDEKSRIPYVIFDEMRLNNKPFSVEKINELSLACLNILKDGHIPMELEEIRISEEEIMLKGRGSDDFVTRVFSDPHLFTIFNIRLWDLYVAGIQRIRPDDYTLGNRWMKNIPYKEVRDILRQEKGDILEEEIDKILSEE